jgi:hypothetical protein
VELDYFIYEGSESDDKIEMMKNIISNTFLVEASKHIKSIKFNNNNLDYEKLNSINKITFVEKLPAFIVQSIIEKVGDYKESINKIQTIDGFTLDISPLLFLNQ